MLAAILKWTKQNKSWLFALSVIVVFCTTYVLILPAITLDQDKAAQQGGIDVPTATETEDTAKAGQASDTDSAPNSDNTTKADSDAADPSADADTDNDGLSFQGDGYQVSVAADAKTGLPLDTQIAAEEITSDSDDYEAWRDEALKALQDQEGADQVGSLKFAKFYDITLSSGGDTIEPAAPVDVIITYDKKFKASDADHIRIVHFAVDKEGNMVPQILDPKDVTLTAKAGEDGDTLRTEAAFPADSFSVYGIVYVTDLHYDAETGTLGYEDSKIKVTVSAEEKDILPDEAALVVKELTPGDADVVDTYAQAITALTDSLREQKSGFSAAKVYDFSILDKEGNEIEPKGEVAVKLEYKEKPDLGEDGRSESDIKIAHLAEDPSDQDKVNVEFVDAEIDATDSGTVSSAEFTTDSFSAYIVFNRDGISETEPTNLGNYGWIRFNTVGEQDTTENQTADPDSPTIQWGYYKNDGSNLPALNTNWAYRRIVKVRLWLPKSGQDSSVYNSDHYNEVATAQYFWVWQNEINVEEFELPGYEVVHTRMHTAWDEENGKQSVENDSLVGSYTVRGYRRSTISDEPGAKNSDLNVLDIYAKALPEITGMRYIIRYVHADGSVSDGNVRSLASGSVTYDASKYQRDGEVYAGTSIVTGTEAISANTNGTGTITYKSDVPLAKVYIYYKINAEGNGNPDNRGRYDKDANGYYTGAKGLYTDKSAETVAGNDRQFILNLESWYIDNAASVGMVLDASGSMAWTSGAPEPIVLTNDQVAAVRRANGMQQNWWGNWSGSSDIYFDGGTNEAVGSPPHSGQYITNFNALSLILDTTKTDNSAMGYNGYHYYLKDMRDSVREYVALGYSDGNQSNSESLGDKTIYTTQVGDSSHHETVLANRFIKNENNAQGPNQGWYYVNSTGNTKAYYKYTGKSYDGYSSKGNTTTPDGTQINLSGGPLRFYIKTGTNELWVSYYDGSKGEIRQSPVYEKRDKMFTKMETLQDAVSQFGAIVLGSSPESQIGLTRFSQQVKNGNDNDDQFFNNTSYLPLLNWSSSTQELAAAMNLSQGAKGSTSKNDDGVTIYEYGLTGQTRTWTGVKAYSDYLKNRATAANHKYLVIFTDGKDTNKDTEKANENPPWGATGTQIQALKDEGYTIITVMMRSQAMVGSEYTDAKAFLQGIASPGLDGNASNTAANNKLYFEADSNSTKDVIDAFRQIANRIASGLAGYTVRDYIDPRFDVVNDAGDVLTVLDSNGEFTHTTNPDVDAATGLRAFTTPDNKQAYLGYDQTKKMFYILWKNQEIPASTLNAANVNPWKSQVRVQAKADFLGGNDILSNGNETGMNQVYYPASTDPTGMTPVSNNTNYPSKDFPKTTTDPGTLELALSNYEDTIFLGETISPASLFESLQTKHNSETDDRSLYFNYLVRAGKKFKNDPTYYTNLLKNGTAPSGTDPGKDLNGNDIPDFVFTTNENGVTELTLPYYYLDNPGDGQSYTGGTLHQGDKVGKVTYSWEATETGNHTLSDNNPLLDYNATTLDTVRYRLSVTYTPDAAKYDSLDANGNVVVDGRIADNGSARTLRLTGQYGTDKLIKDPVGESAQAKTTITNPESMGLAAIHVVAGKIKFTKRIEISESKWNELIAKAGDTGLTFTFRLKKDESNYGNPVSLTMKADNVTRTGNYVELTSDWITDLPRGDYTIEETDMPSGYEFISLSADTVVDTDGDGGVNGRVFAAPTTGSVTWKIGEVSGGIPSSTTYPATDFTADKVMDENKEVDPDKSKTYLNAQIGKGIILNEPPRTIDVTLKKVDIDDISDNNAELLKGAKFTITKYTNSSFNVIDTDSPWSSTLDDEKTGDTYSLNGLFEFKSLPVGYYMINEEKMPDGYITLTENPAFEVRVKDGTSDLEIVLYQKNGNSYEAVSSGTTEIARIAASDTLLVGNTPGAALPNSGGPGTIWMYLLGSLLLVGCGIVLIARRRTRGA